MVPGIALVVVYSSGLCRSIYVMTQNMFLFLLLFSLLSCLYSLKLSRKHFLLSVKISLQNPAVSGMGRWAI